MNFLQRINALSSTCTAATAQISWYDHHLSGYAPGCGQHVHQTADSASGHQLLSTVLLSGHRRVPHVLRSLQKRRAEERHFSGEGVVAGPSAAPPEISSSGWIKGTSTSPAPSAAVCRVPGKGKIVITCPKCGGENHGKKLNKYEKPPLRPCRGVICCLTIPC